MRKIPYTELSSRPVKMAIKDLVAVKYTYTPHPATTSVHYFTGEVATGADLSRDYNVVVNICHHTCLVETLPFIHSFGNKVRCHTCFEVWNVPPKHLIFLAKMSMFGK